MRYSTQYSHVVTDRSTDWAVTSLTLEIGRDPVLSGAYGRNIDITAVPSILDHSTSDLALDNAESAHSSHTNSAAPNQIKHLIMKKPPRLLITANKRIE